MALDADAPGPENGCGVVVLALGKHGARELNYSSDVDLIVLYGPQAAASIPEGTESGPLFVRLTKGAQRALMQERTSEGYVLRVDLRLRLRPRVDARRGSSIVSAYQCYETVGQNWERAAGFIKARPAAGDLKLGERFYKRTSSRSSGASISTMPRLLTSMR